MAVTVKKQCFGTKRSTIAQACWLVRSSRSQKRVPTYKSLWGIAILAERIRPLSSYILFLAGSPQRRQRQPVSLRHQCPPCWSRETIAGARTCPREGDR